MDRPVLVKAVYAYSPAHNDELRLNKGDVITVTQKEEGWWEGTLNGLTGWFPSNYVTALSDDISPTSNKTISSSSSETDSNNSHKFSQSKKVVGGPTLVPAMPSAVLPNDDQLKYRQMVLAELIDTETVFINELQELWNKYLQHLPQLQAFTATEVQCLTGNLNEMITAHATLLRHLELEQTKSFKDQRIGKVFLDHASKLEAVQKAYSENHPKKSKLIDENQRTLEKFMESKGATEGILTLVTSLSLPFRRFEKYPILLQQIERRVEESHKDRGDLQRSIEYFKETDKSCGILRKQKEMELEVLHGTIAGWEGSDVVQLGDIIHMNLVHIGQDLQARYFVLFTNTLLILSYNSEQNTLSYEGKIPVSGVTLPPLSDKNKHLSTAFEIAGPMIDPILVNCISRAARDTWLSQFNKVLKASRYPSHASSMLQSFGQLAPPIQAWSISRLRPTPPTNPLLSDFVPTAGARITPTKGGQGQVQGHLLTQEEDMTILSIVDSFCAGNRLTSGRGSEVTRISEPQPRTLAQLVLSLRDDLTEMKIKMGKLTEQLVSEQGARLAFQDCIQNQLKLILANDDKIICGKPQVN